MKRKPLAHYEFRTKDDTLYWFPLFLNDVNSNIMDIEQRVLEFLKANFKDVKRIDVTDADQHLLASSIVYDYIRERKKGAIKLLTPGDKKKIIKKVEGETTFNFTDELSIYEWEHEMVRPELVSSISETSKFPVHAVNSSDSLNAFENYFIVELQDRIPAYLRLDRLMVFNRATGFLIGLAVTLMAVLSAFEYKSISYASNLNTSPVFVDDYLDEDFEIPRTKIKEPELPKVNTNTEEIKIVSNEEPIEEPKEEPVKEEPTKNIEGAEGVEELPEFLPEIIEEMPKEFAVVENMPIFPGCEHLLTNDERKQCSDQKMLALLTKKQRYPETARELGKEGTVYLTFVIGTSGEVEEVEVLKGVAGGRMLDKEALRLISFLPKFTPGKQRGKKVRVRYNLPIGFELH